MVVNHVVTLGVIGVVAAGILAMITQTFLEYLSQRNLNQQLSMGIQGITGTNNMREISRAEQRAQEEQNNQGN